MKSYLDYTSEEVAWYRKHGKYPERIVRDSEGNEYVIGDESWNDLFPHKPECVELLMAKEIA